MSDIRLTGVALAKMCSICMALAVLSDNSA